MTQISKNKANIIRKYIEREPTPERQRKQYPQQVQQAPQAYYKDYLAQQLQQQLRQSDLEILRVMMDTLMGQLPLGGARTHKHANLHTHTHTHYTRAGLRAAGTGDAEGGAYASACRRGAG
jgi:hypothetical protein